MGKRKETRRDLQNGKRTNSNSTVNKVNEDYNNKKCIWTFDRIDRGGEFAFDINKDDFNTKIIFSKMIDYNSMTWSEIDKQTHDRGKSKHHFVKDIKNLSKECIKRINEIHLDSLFSFALTNKLRIWGLRISGIFHVLWYNPNHEIYPVKKKNT